MKIKKMFHICRRYETYKICGVLFSHCFWWIGKIHCAVFHFLYGNVVSLIQYLLLETNLLFITEFM